MIKIPTVLILGAGASCPYGFPMGKDLVRIICQKLVDENSSSFMDMHLLGYKRSDIIKFRNALFFSGKKSVDSFLEHRRELIDIGKSSIAQALMEFENSTKLFGIGDWYQYLYDKLNTSFEEFDQNKLSIITFNYDRSIEHYLFTALKNSYGKNDDDCAAKIKGIPIIHLHGQLGYLPWQDKDGRAYEKPESYINDIPLAASKIKIIHEDIKINEDESFIAAKSLLEKSRRIYFLGFGYNETNIKRLSIPPGKDIKGTAYNLERAEKNDVDQIFRRNYGHGIPLDDDKKMDSLLFLRNYTLD